MFKWPKKESKEIRQEIQNILDDLISNHDKWHKTTNRYVRGDDSDCWIYLGEGSATEQVIALSVPYNLHDCEKQALANAIVNSIFLTAIADDRSDNK